MPKVTTAYAKNIIRRSFRELVDPTPQKDELDSLWLHFDSRCAYCGAEVKRGSKSGHIDHLVSASRGGPNHISNRVLSCAQCNEVEKRELDWEGFLRSKCKDAILDQRRLRILQWSVTKNPDYVQDQLLLTKAAELANEVVALYDQKITELRTQRL